MSNLTSEVRFDLEEKKSEEGRGVPPTTGQDFTAHVRDLDESNVVATYE